MPTLPWAGESLLLVIAKMERKRVPSLQNLVLPAIKQSKPLPPVFTPSHLFIS